MALYTPLLFFFSFGVCSACIYCIFLIHYSSYCINRSENCVSLPRRVSKELIQGAFLNNVGSMSRFLNNVESMSRTGISYVCSNNSHAFMHTQNALFFHHRNALFPAAHRALPSARSRGKRLSPDCSRPANKQPDPQLKK